MISKTMLHRLKSKEVICLMIILFLTVLMVSFFLINRYGTDNALEINANVWEDEYASKTIFPKTMMEQEFIMTYDPKLGYVPVERKFQAYDLVQKRRVDFHRQTNARAIQGVSWMERGPADYGGRTRAVMFDPNDAVNDYKKVWAGSVSGGLWFNDDITDPQSSWQVVNDHMGNLSIGCITYDPSNTQIFYGYCLVASKRC